MVDNSLYTNFDLEYSKTIKRSTGVDCNTQYHKLKLIFVCMLVLNAILVVIILCMSFLTSPPSESTPNGTQARHSSQESPNVRCLSIKNKLSRLYRNGQMVDMIADNDECSVDDMLDSFIKYFEITQQRQKLKRSLAYHLTSNNTLTERCTNSRVYKCLKNWDIRLNTTSLTVKDGTIYVPASGSYFIYSRVDFHASINTTKPVVEFISHVLRYSISGNRYRNLEVNRLKFESHANLISHVSYLEKIEYMEEGSRIKIALDLPQHIDMKPAMTMGTFGMFSL